MPLGQKLPPIALFSGLLTGRETYRAIYESTLARDKTSALPPSERYFSPHRHGLGTIEKMIKVSGDQLEDAVEKMDGEKVLLVAHSLGAINATEVAIERPELVAGVVLLGGAHAGYKKQTPFTFALRNVLGRHPQAGHLKYDSGFMKDRAQRMAEGWPKGVLLDVHATMLDELLPPPHGLDIEIANEIPGKYVHVPRIPGLMKATVKLFGPHTDVELMPTNHLTLHANLPSNPNVNRRIRALRYSIAGMVDVHAPVVKHAPAMESMPLAA